jgi:amidase
MPTIPNISGADTARTGLICSFELGEGALTASVKDCIDIAGLPTRQGSAVFAEAGPALANAAVVDALLASGRWRIVGKAAMHELAFGVTGINPWGHAGQPAVAGPDRGWVFQWFGCGRGGGCRRYVGRFGHGRICASACGLLWGDRFQARLWGRQPPGVNPAYSSIDCVGPIARDLAVIEAAMTAMVEGFAPVAAPKDSDIRLVRLSPEVSEDVGQAFDLALSGLTTPVLDAQLPSFDEAFDASLVVMGAENWAALGAYADHPGMGEDVRARLKAGGRHDADAVAAAKAVGAQLAREIDAVLEQADALILPTLPIVPPSLVEAQDARAVVPLTRLVRPFNLSGHPAITLPIRTAQGLPAGVQLVGRRGGDAALLALATTIAAQLGLQEKEA